MSAAVWSEPPAKQPAAAALDLSLLREAEIERLPHTAMAWWHFLQDSGAAYQPEQDGRFEVTTEHPLGERWLAGRAEWVDTTSDALLLLAARRSQGHDAVLLWDLAENPDPQWAVVSTLPLNLGG